MLPVELWRMIGRYIKVCDVLRLQVAIGTEIENKNIIRLRYRHEPYCQDNVSCTYKAGVYRVVWEYMPNMKMYCYDRRSLSSRQAVKSMCKLLNQQYK